MKRDWRQIVLYITVFGMEGCWLYAFMAFLNNRAADNSLSVLLILGIFPLSFGINLLLRQLKWPLFLIRTISWFLWIIAMLISIKIQLFINLPWADTQWLLALPRAFTQIFYEFRPELLILVSSAIIWWLGRRLAYVNVRFSLILAEFQFGLIVLLAIFFINAHLDISIPNSFPVILAFFIFAFCGIPLAHTLEGESWLSGLYRGRWSIILGISIVLILILGLVISSIVTPNLLQIILDGIKWLWEQFVKVLTFIMSLLPEPEATELPPELAGPGMGGSNEVAEKSFSIPDWLRSGMGMTIIALWGGLTVLAVWRLSSEIAKWLRRRLASMAGAEYERVPTSIRADLMSLLKRIVSFISRIRVIFHLMRKSTAIRPEVAPVYQVYRQFLHWADKGGLTRTRSQTPNEYLLVLAERLPDARNELAYITQQYVAARYGTLFPDEDEVRRLRQTWLDLKKVRLKKEINKHP